MRLDELAQAADSSGFTLVHAPEQLLGPIARHLARRASAAGRKVVVVDGVGIAQPWRELVRSLHADGSDDPMALASALFDRAEHAVVIVCAPRPTRWGAAVADEIARLASTRSCTGWFIELSSGRRSPYATPLTVSEQADPRELEQWWHTQWQAERDAGSLASVERLDQLERWWQRTRAASTGNATSLSTKAEALLARLSLCGRRVPAEMRQRLGSAAAAEELVQAGLISIDGEGATSALVAPPGPARKDVLAAARCLKGSPDRWDRMRAAELLVGVGEWEQAATLAEQAIDDEGDPCARADLWSRWEQALAPLSDASCAGVLRSFSELALRLGDVDPAFVLAQRAIAMTDDDEGYDVLLCLGKATAARGEHGAAARALEQAVERAPTKPLRAQALVELADVCCANGEAAGAAELAHTALKTPCDDATQLGARNVLGKLLLASGDWQQAEWHFAADAHKAACAGETEAELRALLNHATALLMGGRRSEAQARFESVLEAAERNGVLRATAFALSNLAVLACYRHEYAEALSLRERSIRVFRRIGNRRWLARSMTYLADLRLDLGLVDEAEQALAFARRVLGQALQPTQAAWMGYVTSRIHLARGNTGDASATIEDALRSAERSTDGTMLRECRCQAARVALAEGDAARASKLIAKAKATCQTPAPAAQAELALLDAALARVTGDAFEAAAKRALELSRRAGDAVRMAEAYTQLHHAAEAQGDAAAARRQLNTAYELHSAIAATLPAELRERYQAHVAGTKVVTSHKSAPTAPKSDARHSRHVNMVGSHPSMQRLARIIDKVAPTDTTVLICGESGTGKELVTDAIHRRSMRSAGPLVKVNCAALVETLLLSELFGHEKGAFTGATSRRLGCFEHAEGGTIFLDEIGDVSPGTQAALLRVLQDRTFQRVGGTELVHSDVRVVCATHRDLGAMVSAGRFREDLYYRLRGVVLELPPLRDRLEDIPLLCADILLRIAREQEHPLKRLSPDALSLLSRHHWPGNVRELENSLRAAALFVETTTITAADLRRYAAAFRQAVPPDQRAPAAAEQPTVPATGRGSAPDSVYATVRNGTGLREVQKQLEYHCIVQALRETGGHITRAAALLGIKRPRLSQLIKEHDLKNNQEAS